MNLITEDYIEINRILHDKHPTYGMSGHRWAPKIIRLISDYQCRSLLDYGCGKGTLKVAIEYYYPFIEIIEYDPAIYGKNSLPSPADIVVCTDVLEHVEPECINDVLNHIRTLTNKIIFITVATRPAKKMLSDGRNAHLIINTQEWWVNKIEKYFVH